MSQVVTGRGYLGGTRPVDAPRVAAPAAARPALWRAEDLLRWLITVGIGGIVIAVCWYVCAGDASFGQQVGPANVAVAGVLVAGIGNATWVLKGRRALGERRRALLPDVVTHDPSLGSVDTPHDPFAGASTDDDAFVAGTGMERFHRAGCPLASGRQGWTTMPRHEHEAAGRLPCGVCRP